MQLLFLLISLLLAQPSPADTTLCPGAPLPRLRPGQAGEVIVDSLNLRMLPAVGTGEVRRLYTGTPFEVLAGPSCNGGYSWWRIELDGGVTGWVAEGTWTAYYLRPVPAEGAPASLCQQAESPWLHLLVTTACTLLGA